MAFPYRYGTTPPSAAHHDTHLPSNDDRHLPATSYWFGHNPPFSSYQCPSRPSSSSSLAGALDEDAAKMQPRRHDHVYSFPESEVMPVAQPLSPLSATSHAHRGAVSQYYLSPDFQQYSDLSSPREYWTDEAMSVEASSPQYPMQPLQYAPYDPAPYHAESELGCMNGQVMQTGILGNTYLTDASPSPSLEHDFHAPLPSPVTMSPFPLTRSYTLEGAVTPVEDRRQARSPNNTLFQTPQTESLASPDADPTEPASAHTTAPAPARVRPKKTKVPASTASPPTPPPHSPANASALFTKFSTKQPFRAVLPPPLPPTAAGDRPVSAADAEGVLESVVEDVKGPVHPPQAKKKPTMACLFCRERKICCGPPAPDSPDPRCKQCIKRDQQCVFPKECRRGQHKRTQRKANIHALAGATFPEDSSSSNTPPADPAAAASPSHSTESASTSSNSSSNGSSTAAPTSATVTKAKAITQKAKAATTQKRARSRDAKMQAGHRSASTVRSRPPPDGALNRSPSAGPSASSSLSAV